MQSLLKAKETVIVHKVAPIDFSEITHMNKNWRVRDLTHFPVYSDYVQLCTDLLVYSFH